MEDLRAEIEHHFANGREGRAYRIACLGDEWPAWVIRLPNGRFGVIVPYDGAAVSEQFAGAVLRKWEQDELGPHIPAVVGLLSSTESSRNEFSQVCADFVTPGENGAKRVELARDPYIWWERWKQLLGNYARDMKPYSVVAELLTYLNLLREGCSVAWKGPSAASHDLQSEDFDAEVKATLKRYGYHVNISGQFQLQDQNEKLYLYFCRLEPHPNGASIDDVVRVLSKTYEIPADQLNSKLAALGYEPGARARREGYALQEMRRYTVNSRFPRITPEMLKEGEYPAGVVKISYEVDLADVPCDIMEIRPLIRELTV